MQPIIGIIMRANKSETNKNIQIVYDDIIKAVKASGGEAIGIPYDNIKDYFGICKGFILQGGDEFSQIDMDNIKLLHENNIPLLGICLGMQEMSYINNGLIKDITGHNDGYHEVIIVKDSLLYKIIKKDKILVNSRHKSAIVSTNLKVSSYAGDGYIESIEDDNCKFFLGIQWHPENMYDIDYDSKKIFDYFVKICHY